MGGLRPPPKAPRQASRPTYLPLDPTLDPPPLGTPGHPPYGTPRHPPLPHIHTPPLPYPILPFTPTPPYPWVPPYTWFPDPPTLASGSRKVPRTDPAGGLARNAMQQIRKKRDKTHVTSITNGIEKKPISKRNLSKKDHLNRITTKR